jgi:hypothetical protein
LPVGLGLVILALSENVIGSSASGIVVSVERDEMRYVVQGVCDCLKVWIESERRSEMHRFCDVGHVPASERSFHI